MDFSVQFAPTIPYLHGDRDMKVSLSHLLITSLSVFLFSPNAMALGLGLYLSQGSGDSEWERDSDGRDFDRDVSQKEFGFVLDTTVAQDKLFNYRLNVGRLWVEYDDFEMDGIIASHSFGFAFVREKNVRVWAGPQLSVKYLESDSGNTTLSGIGVGPIVGVNVNLDPSITLAADAGIRGIYSYAEYDSDYSSSFDEEYDINENELFVNFSVLFRLGNDNY